MSTNIHRPGTLLSLFAVAVLAAGLMALLVPRPAWAESRSFAPAPNSPFPVGSSPNAVTNADFNGDGKTDLATPNSGSSSVSVLPGNGDGTFDPKQDFAVGSGPSSAATGHFNDDNGDGKADSADFVDLAVANAGPDSVSVLLGNGDGTFQPKQDFAVPRSGAFVASDPSSVISADFNGDAKADLATANSESHAVSVLLGNGDGTFQAAQNFSMGSVPNQVITADFNGDNKLDLATANSGRSWANVAGGFSVRLGNGDGTFQGSVSHELDHVYSITTADFNGDGKVDLVVPLHDSKRVWVYLNTGDGTFINRQIIPTVLEKNARAVTAGDFDGDDKADVAVTNSNVSFDTPGVSVLWGNGDGGFQAPLHFPTGGQPFSAIDANLDADDFADLAVANRSFNHVSVLLNTPPDTSPPPPPVITSAAIDTPIVTDPNLTVRGTAEASTTVELFEGPRSWGTASVGSNGQWSKTVFSVADGQHTYTARARDVAGNVSDPSDPVTVDVGTPPRVISVSPFDRSQNAALSTDVTATFSEAMNEASVEAQGTFTLKQGSSSPIAATVTYDSNSRKATLTPSSSLAWNATYTATILGGSNGAKDLAGNALEQDYSWSFTTVSDTTAPSTTHTLSVEPNAAGWHNSNVTVTLNSTDTGGSGVKEIRYSTSGAQSIPETLYDPQNPPVIDTEGTTTVTYFATDNAGNQESPAKTFTVKIDKSAPSAPLIIGPANNSFDRDGDITISGTAEANSTVEVFRATASGEASKGTTQADASGAWSKTLSGVPNGSHTYRAKAKDAAGNTSGLSNARTVVVDTAKPSGTVLINNGAASTASRSVTLKLRASDPAPASGVAQMRFSNDGQTWSAWQTYATSKSWTLTSGAGTKTVYVQYKDRAGNISARAKDSITYRP